MVEHRSPKPGVGGSMPLAPASDEFLRNMNKKNILAFISQVKQEALKVTWPVKSEARSSTIIVIVMVFISSFFFLLVDTLAFKSIQFILGIGN